MSSSLHTNEAARVNFTRLGIETLIDTSSPPFLEGIAPPPTQESGWTGLSASHESTPFVAPTWELPGASPTQDASDPQRQEAAQKQVEALLQGAEREAQQIKEEAYAAGFAAGEERGFEAGQQRLQAMIDHLGQTLQEVGRLRSQLFAQSERELLELSLAIARKVLHHEASVNRDGILSLIRAGIMRVSQRQELRIKVHPDDLLCTVSYKARLMSLLDGIETMAFEEDETVPPGSCVVETPTEIVDLRWEEQLEELAASLFETYEQQQRGNNE